MSSSIPNTIPLNACTILLPHPGLSVSEFLQFPLPNISPNSVTEALNVTDFLSEENANTVVDEKLIRELPIPGRAILEKIHQYLPHLDQQNYHSVKYAHLLEGVGLTHLPQWVLVYWVEVLLLRNHVHEPWKKAEDWLNSQQNRFRSGEKCKLCDKAFLAMQTLPWAGHVYGFTDKAPVTTLTRYLSRRWLASVHIDQQLDFLRRDLAHTTPEAQYEIVDTTFFNKLQAVFCEWLTKPYNADSPGARRLWRFGEELAEGIQTKVGGVGNIDDSHWVGYMINVEPTKCQFLYGDSFGNEPTDKVAAAFCWWVMTHVKHQCIRGKLPISSQTDSYSCRILSTNAVLHDTLPGVHLVDPKDCDEARIALFVRVAHWNLESVIIFKIIIDKIIDVSENQHIDIDIPDGHIAVYKIERADGGFVFDPITCPNDQTSSITFPAPSSVQSSTLSFPLPDSPLHNPIDIKLANPSIPQTIRPTELIIPQVKNPSVPETSTKQKTIPHEASSSKQNSSGIKDLRQWLFVASPEELAAQRAHLKEEFLEDHAAEEERERVREAQRKRQKTENDRQRKREQRVRDKEKDIRIGKCDSNGKLKPTKVSEIL